MAQELITASEAAKRLGVKRSWISRLCQQGRIPDAQKVGTVWVIPVGAEILPPPPRKATGPPLRATRIPTKKS